MKKSTLKVIKHLSQYIGHKVIRTKPAGIDWSYTCEDPLLLVGFTSDGCIRYRHTGFNARCCFGDKEFVLPIHFTDRNWITYKKALKAKGNKLNKWKGKKIRLTARSGNRPLSEPFTMISASKHHIVVMYNELGLKGEKSVFSLHYTDHKNWELAE